MAKIGIVSAFYKEAELIIKHYNLKKQNAPFELFCNDNIFVIISNIGKLNSAIATTYLINQFNIDFIINFGIAGSSEYEVGDIFLVNMIRLKRVKFLRVLSKLVFKRILNKMDITKKFLVN